MFEYTDTPSETALHTRTGSGSPTAVVYLSLLIYEEAVGDPAIPS